MKLTFNRPFFLLILFAILLYGCGPGPDQRIQDLEGRENAGSFPLRMAYMDYIFRNHKDKDQSVEYCRRLVESSYFTEARYGLSHIREVFGPDPEFDYLTAVCFRNQLQFDSAVYYIEAALDKNAESALYQEEKMNILEDQDIWMEIERVNKKLVNTDEELLTRVKRAELLTRAGWPEAALFDINEVYAQDSLFEPVLIQAGYTHLFMTEFEKSLDFFRKAYNLTQEGSIEEIVDEISRIQSATEKIAEGDSDAVNYISVARSLSKLGFYEPSINYLDKGLNEGSDPFRLLYAKLLLHIEWGDMETAREVYIRMRTSGYEVDKKVEALFN